MDDYPFWRKHEYAPWSGKPIWMLPADDSHYHDALYDDDIHNLLNDGIASIRQQEISGGSFCTLSSPEILKQHGTHLIRTPTVEPSLNPDWFLERLLEL